MGLPPGPRMCCKADSYPTWFAVIPYLSCVRVILTQVLCGLSLHKLCAVFLTQDLCGLSLHKFCAVNPYTSCVRLIPSQVVCGYPQIVCGSPLQICKFYLCVFHVFTNFQHFQHMHCTIYFI